MYEYRAKCVRVVDGDTVDLDIDPAIATVAPSVNIPALVFEADSNLRLCVETLMVKLGLAVSVAY